MFVVGIKEKSKCTVCRDAQLLLRFVRCNATVTNETQKATVKTWLIWYSDSLRSYTSFSPGCQRRLRHGLTVTFTVRTKKLTAYTY